MAPKDVGYAAKFFVTSLPDPIHNILCKQKKIAELHNEPVIEHACLLTGKRLSMKLGVCILMVQVDVFNIGMTGAKHTFKL